MGYIAIFSKCHLDTPNLSPDEDDNAWSQIKIIFWAYYAFINYIIN